MLVYDSLLPEVTEMVSNALVISAEQCFQTKSRSLIPKTKKTKFSPQLNDAYLQHKKICKIWRESGRPNDSLHPAKAAKLQSQRLIQKLARLEHNKNMINFQNELMEMSRDNMGAVCAKMKHFRGSNSTSTDIPYLDTLCGKYEGANILEGFRRNAEVLCNEIEESDRFESDFLQMCKEDNNIIAQISHNEDKIPPMNLINLKDILFKKLKLNKACDAFKMTVEHLRYAGDNTLLLIVRLINKILSNINTLSSPQLNTAIATVVYKGKNKSIYSHKSYRLVRVTPLISRLIDEYVRPFLQFNYRPLHNPNQYGFTTGMSYLMAALQRHETEMFCVDRKMSFFTVSLDGQSAFEVINRDIQKRELYFAGETGEYWQTSTAEYQSSMTRIKMNGKMSKEFEEKLGNKQGTCKASDHYKVYVAPALEMIDMAELGVWIGPVNSGVSCCADDILGLTNDQHKLQCIIDIASHYGWKYRVEYGADKTKVTVSGSDIDRQFYRDTQPWTMDNQTIEVVDNNDHLGLIISGKNQEQKNVDLKISKARKSLFSLLGAGFAYKCNLSPAVKLHLFRTYTCPILRSGLCSLALGDKYMKSLSLFQRKILKSFLYLSKTASTPAIHFLTGELPVEGQIHRDIFSLFYNVWTNPTTKIYKIVHYLLQNSEENSRTWAVHLRYLSKMYNLEDPLSCLERDPPSKSSYSELVKTKITQFHEKELRAKAETNTYMKYFNVNLLGLSGKLHPAITGIYTENHVRVMKPHIRMLIGNFTTYKLKSERDSQTSSKCRICNSDEYEDDIVHILTFHISTCMKQILEEIKSLCLMSKSSLDFSVIEDNPDTLTQFILDPASMNLNQRVNISDPILPELYKKCRDYCYTADKERRTALSLLSTQ